MWQSATTSREMHEVKAISVAITTARTKASQLSVRRIQLYALQMLRKSFAQQPTASLMR